MYKNNEKKTQKIWHTEKKTESLKVPYALYSNKTKNVKKNIYSIIKLKLS